MSASSTAAAPPARKGLDERSPLTWALFVVVTLVFAVGSVWPFLTAWWLRETPAYAAATAWVLESPATEEVVGINRRIESPWFPRGGQEGDHARFEFKLTGAEKEKQPIGVIVQERDGKWVVTRAAWYVGEETRELAVE